ncbi:hypothetical protein CXB51_017208 [Gossypium anomalum]|uniref:Uncharacterized protein n=1 Tax=Gossypium anomalum TaxID=47600 RepID=A0A8J6D0Q4_9ROSI|nr:hypothetical protein CXB51_017208 [Gossypium anomalum]
MRDPPHLSTWGPSSHFSISLPISPFLLIHCINNWCGEHGSNLQPEEFAVIWDAEVPVIIFSNIGKFFGFFNFSSKAVAEKHAEETCIDCCLSEFGSIEEWWGC